MDLVNRQDPDLFLEPLRNKLVRPHTVGVRGCHEAERRLDLEEGVPIHLGAAAAAGRRSRPIVVPLGS
jgi:hypothetical protein